MSAVCKSCGAAILWAETVNGKRIPLDAEPVKRNLPGLFRLQRATAGRDFAGRALPPEPLYASHFATCPNAAAHRKRC